MRNSERVEQVALGNNYSTAREGEVRWEVCQEKGLDMKGSSSRHESEPWIIAGAQLCVHPIPTERGSFYRTL